MLLARLRRLTFFLVALAPSVCTGQDSVGGEPWANRNRGIAPPCLFLYTCAAWLQEPD
ncbi:MAG: hypothetical protein HYV93_05965 [Candidatus Rokubacteria bacterium]|nr:hypothetical protein [Candidatus Rokubacteria bacterium]